MSGWEKYFARNRDGFYRYKDMKVVKLPDNLPMPPITNMREMFSSCTQLQDITALANWDVSKVTNTGFMFASCVQLQDISPLTKWDVSSVTNMRHMFANCAKLQDVTALANWDVSKVTSIHKMFLGCKLLRKTDIPETISSKYDHQESPEVQCKNDNGKPIEQIPSTYTVNKVAEYEKRIKELEARLSEYEAALSCQSSK